MEILRIARQNESLTRSFSPPQCGQAFLPVHLASNTGGTWLTTFSIAKSRKPIKNLSTGLSLLFFGRKIKAALVGIPALLGMPIFLSRRYAPVFEVEPVMAEAVKWGMRRARINSISPGIIITPLALDEINGPRGDFYRNMFAKCPARRPGTADEIANVAELLMSDRGAFITGTDILVDGGATASFFYGPLKPAC